MRPPRATQGTVYRALASDGTVLYVGMTTRFAERLKEHSKASAWWPLHARIERDGWLPLDEAFLSEADQIAQLRPQFNQIGGVETRFRHPAEREPQDWKLRYESGETLEEIALDAHVMPGTVRKHLIALGTEMRRPGRRVGVDQKHRAKPGRTPASPAIVHVALAGTRGVHRRRGGGIA